MVIAPISGAIVSDLAPEELRARYMGVFTFSYTAAIMIGPPLGGALLAHSGDDSLWAACVCVGLFCAALFRSNQLWPRKPAGL